MPKPIKTFTNELLKLSIENYGQYDPKLIKNKVEFKIQPGDTPLLISVFYSGQDFVVYATFDSKKRIFFANSIESAINNLTRVMDAFCLDKL